MHCLQCVLGLLGAVVVLASLAGLGCVAKCRFQIVQVVRFRSCRKLHSGSFHVVCVLLELDLHSPLGALSVFGMLAVLALCAAAVTWLVRLGG